MNPPVRLSVGWLVGWLAGPSVWHNFLKGREVTLPCYVQSFLDNSVSKHMLQVDDDYVIMQGEVLLQ